MAWIEIVHDDQRELRAQADALQAVLVVPGEEPASRYSALTWILQQLAPALDTHLQRHEAVLFPALEQVIGRHAGALKLMRTEHEELRQLVARLEGRLERQGPMERLEELVGLLVTLMADHAAKTERLVVDILRHTLTSGAQDALAEALAAHGAPDRRLETSVSEPLVRAVA